VVGRDGDAHSGAHLRRIEPGRPAGIVVVALRSTTHFLPQPRSSGFCSNKALHLAPESARLDNTLMRLRVRGDARPASEPQIRRVFALARAAGLTGPDGRADRDELELAPFCLTPDFMRRRPLR